MKNEAVRVGSVSRPLRCVRCVRCVGWKPRFTVTAATCHVSGDVFRVDPTTGDVFLRRQLDREEQSLYVLTVVATDRGSPPLSGFTRVTVRISRYLAVLRGIAFVWLNGLVVSALGIRTRGPRFDFRVVPLFHWVATLGKLFTHIASAVSQLHETGVQKEVFGA